MCCHGDIVRCHRDIVRLTAQFVARNGPQFMDQLMAREQKNETFDFLRKNHILFSYFIKLVEQYSKVGGVGSVGVVCLSAMLARSMPYFLVFVDKQEIKKISLNFTNFWNINSKIIWVWHAEVYILLVEYSRRSDS